MALESEAKAATKAFKTHWVAAGVLILAALLVGLRYDRKNSGKLSLQLAKLPLVGGWFST